MTKVLSYLALALTPCAAQAGFANYNSVLIGEEAAGLGGAYTAFHGDPAACSFYNPAALARMEGNTLSAAVNIYNKYDTQFGDLGDYNQAPLRINRGSIMPLPDSSGTVYNFGNFALGLSIVFPDFDQYTGEVRNSATTTSYLNLRDESLWVGGSLAMNVTADDSVGLTMYYTSRTYTRSLIDQTTDAGVTTQTTSEKSFSQNSLVYLLGYQRQLSNEWSVGASVRLPSIPIAGQGSFFATEITNAGGPVTPVTISGLHANTKIPPRYSLGIGYVQRGRIKIGADVHGYGPESYEDLSDSRAADLIQHRATLNYSLGLEHYLKPWLAWRLGFYTNFSSFGDVPENPSTRGGDHIDMWGFATNFAIFTSKASAVTLGGSYSGGKGYSVQQIGQQLTKVPKSQQIFSFLVGTAFYF